MKAQYFENSNQKIEIKSDTTLLLNSVVKVVIPKGFKGLEGNLGAKKDVSSNSIPQNPFSTVEYHAMFVILMRVFSLFFSNEISHRTAIKYIKLFDLTEGKEVVSKREEEIEEYEREYSTEYLYISDYFELKLLILTGLIYRVNLKTLIDDCNYTGSDNNSYQFRYQVRDNANNWSDWATGGIVTINKNDPPSATNLDVYQRDYCQISYPNATFSWKFVDPDQGDKQSAYQVQIDDNSNFSSLEHDTGKIISFSDAYASPRGVLSWNTKYYWRVRVWDQSDISSDWKVGPSFITPIHRYPSLDFSWQPEPVFPGQNVLFLDDSTCFDEEINGAECSSQKPKIDSFSWTFEGGNPASSTEENPIVTFFSSGAKKVILQVRDSDGFSCSKTKYIKPRRFYPGFYQWREIIPW